METVILTVVVLYYIFIVRAFWCLTLILPRAPAPPGARRARAEFPAPVPRGGCGASAAQQVLHHRRLPLRAARSREP